MSPSQPGRWILFASSRTTVAPSQFTICQEWGFHTRTMRRSWRGNVLQSHQSGQAPGARLCRNLHQKEQNMFSVQLQGFKGSDVVNASRPEKMSTDVNICQQCMKWSVYRVCVVAGRLWAACLFDRPGTNQQTDSDPLRSRSDLRCCRIYLHRVNEQTDQHQSKRHSEIRQ